MAASGNNLLLKGERLRLSLCVARNFIFLRLYKCTVGDVYTSFIVFHSLLYSVILGGHRHKHVPPYEPRFFSSRAVISFAFVPIAAAASKQAAKGQI